MKMARKLWKKGMAPSEVNESARAMMASVHSMSLADRIRQTVADAEVYINRCAEDDYRATQRAVPLESCRMMLVRGQHPCLAALRLIEERGE